MSGFAPEALWTEYSLAFVAAPLTVFLLGIAIWLLRQSFREPLRRTHAARWMFIAVMAGIAARIAIFDYPAGKVQNLTAPQELYVALGESSASQALWRLFACSRVNAEIANSLPHLKRAKCVSNTHRSALDAYRGVQFLYAWLTLAIAAMLVLGTLILVTCRLTLESVLLRVLAVFGVLLCAFTSSAWFGAYVPRNQFFAYVSADPKVNGFILQELNDPRTDDKERSASGRLRLLAADEFDCSGVTATTWTVRIVDTAAAASTRSEDAVTSLLTSSACPAFVPPASGGASGGTEKETK